MRETKVVKESETSVGLILSLIDNDMLRMGSDLDFDRMHTTRGGRCQAEAPSLDFRIVNVNAMN